MIISNLSCKAVQSIAAEAFSSVLCTSKTVTKLRAHCLALVVRDVMTGISHARESAVFDVVAGSDQSC